MQAGMHTDWQGGRLGCRRGCVQTGREEARMQAVMHRLAGREARMQAGMHTDWQGGRLGCRRGWIQTGREGG